MRTYGANKMDWSACNRTIQHRRALAAAAEVREPEPLDLPDPIEPEPLDLPEHYDDWDDADVDSEQCYRCGGPAEPLGALGHRLHFRCRNCGAEQSRVIVR